MKRMKLNLIVSAVAVVFSLAAVLPSGSVARIASESVQKSTPDYYVNKTAVTSEVATDDDGINEKLAPEEPISPESDPADGASTLDTDSVLMGMLNMNHCYGTAFDDVKEMGIRAAVALSDYSVELEGIGFGVNASLVSGFMKSFYGVDVDYTELEADGAEGYVLIPSVECGDIIHTPVSITETDGRITVVTCVEIYSGGDELETFLASSEFVRNEASEFGLNLLYSELL